jgi:hypothetical protein
METLQIQESIPKPQNQNQKKSNENMSNEYILNEDMTFWLDNPSILFERNNFFEVIPLKDMTTTQKLNALMRLSIYVGIVLYLITSKYDINGKKSLRRRRKKSK